MAPKGKGKDKKGAEGQKGELFADGKAEGEDMDTQELLVELSRLRAQN